MSSASGAGPSIKTGSATTNVISFAATNATSSAKPSVGINPTFRVSNAKASSAKRAIKSSSSAKAASLAKVSSSINKSSINKLLFVSKEESFTKLPTR